MSPNNTTIAFFGATGGSAFAALALTIEAGFNARALVRTPQKLTDLLQKRGITEDVTRSKLVILQGNAKDGDAVAKTLVDDSGKVVDQIVFGVGGTPKFTPNPLKPTLDDPVVCQSSMSAVVASLKDVFSKPDYRHAPKPLLIAISTTGLTAKRDVPLAMMPLYHWMLATPHEDKKIMEKLIEEAKAEGSIGDFVIVRASLLTNGKREGLAKTRVGWEGGEADGKGPAVGYTISREDVGGFIFDEVVNNQTPKFHGKKLTVTY